MAELLAQLPFLPKEEQEMYLEYPALEHPEGNPPQFDNPPNRNTTGYGVVGLMLFLASFAVLTRLYVKIFSIRKVNIEEFVMLAAFGPYVGFIWCAFNVPKYAGFWVHQWDVSLRNLSNIRWVVHIGSVCYSFTNPLIKTAILLEWTRIFVPTGTRNAFFWTCYTLITGLLILVVAGVIAVFLECRPYEAIWKFTIANPTCIDKAALELSTASVHLFFDIMVLLLPQKVIWGLQMNLKQKIGVSIMFSVGLAACASACFRLVSNTEFASSPDVTYTLTPVTLACIAEMTCGFIIFGTPTLPRAFKDSKIASSISSGFKSIRGKSTGKSAPSSGNSRGQGLPRSQNSVDAYHKLGDSSMALGNLSAVKKGSYSSESTEHLHSLPRQGPAIVRTTKFSTTEERVSGNGRGLASEFDRQHPWEGRV